MKSYHQPQWIWVCGLLLVSAQVLAADATPRATASVTSSTRETDYTIGSIVQQHVQIAVPKGYVLEASSLPAAAQNEAIELRDARWTVVEPKPGQAQTKDLAQADLAHIDLTIDWQVFVAAETVRSIPLKPLHLVFQRNIEGHRERLQVDVPADKILVSSLLPPRMDDAHVKLYDDAPLPAWSVATEVWKLVGWGLLWLVSMIYIGWVQGWIQLPQEKHMPFRQAWRAMRRLSGSASTQSRQAMQLLGRAMDQFAGRVVTAENLAEVLQQHPALQAHAEALHGFYQQVQQTFFAGLMVSHSPEPWIALARKLSRIEVS